MSSAESPQPEPEPVDLHTTPQSLARAVTARRSEFVRPREIRVKIGTWNVAACPGTDKDLASWFVDGYGIDKHFAALDLSHNPAVTHDLSASNQDDSDSIRLAGGDEIGLYVLGLQEVVDLNLTRDYVNRAVKTDNSLTEKWQAALEAALPEGYQLITSELMTGLLLLIYASPEIAPSIANVSSKQIGTGGLLGYFGNKGAVMSRLVLGETTRLVFINCHLASGAAPSHLDRRCWDVDQIISKTRFDPIVHAGVSEDDGELLGEEDFAFWFGDLNFRLDGLPGDDIRRILMLHTNGEYDLNADRAPRPLDGEGVIVMRGSESDDDTTIKSSLHSRQQSFDSNTTLPDPDDFPEDPSQDPASLQATLDSLLPHDQLRRVMTQKKAFHDGWREGPVTFLPTYKYDIGTVGLYDSSEKRRSPSWCDRILYRTRKDKQNHEDRAREEEAAKKKDAEMHSRGIDEDDDVLFTYNPDTDGDDQSRPDARTPEYDEYEETEDNEAQQEVITKDGQVDRVRLDIYTSHQRISSSDHKPVISMFTLEYDAVVPELKAKVHAEVARELDRAENEGRPAITVVVEGHSDTDESTVDFGRIGFLEKKSCVVVVANTGSVPAEFSFVEKPTMDDQDSATVDWLKTSFVQPDGEPLSHQAETITLDPGDTILARIEAHVSATSHLRSLNDGRSKLEDILVLRVEGGRDHFVPVKGSWLPTCFGRSVDELIRVPDGGIRNFVLDKDIQGAIPYEFEVRCSAPKELFKLTEAIQALAERCVADEAMLEDMVLPQDVGWPFEPSTWSAGIVEQDAVKADMVAALDTDASITEVLPVELASSHKLELLSSVLLLFLASLTDGLVPPLVWAKLSTALPNLSLSSSSSSTTSTKWAHTKTQILDILSSAPNHNISFLFLTSTLSRVATELGSAASSLPGLSRRLSFRRTDGDQENRRRLRQRKYAEVIGPLAFRTHDRAKAVKERERVLVEIFLSREADG